MSERIMNIHGQLVIENNCYFSTENTLFHDQLKIVITVHKQIEINKFYLLFYMYMYIRTSM